MTYIITAVPVQKLKNWKEIEIYLGVYFWLGKFNRLTLEKSFEINSFF